MKKISTKSSNNILLKFILKVIFSTVLCLIFLSYVTSKIVYVLDLNTNIDLTLTLLICAITSAVTAAVSVYGIKNNGLLLGALSQIHLILYSLLNVIFNENTYLFFIIKVIIVILVGMLFGFLSSKKSSKLRIK